MDQKQITIADDFFRNSFRGQFEEAKKALDPDVTYTVPGTHQLAGTFVGAEAVAEHVGALLRLTSDRVDVIQWEDWLAGINHIAGLVHLRLQRDRAIADTRFLYLVSMSAEDKIKAIQVFLSDQAAVERFFR